MPWVVMFSANLPGVQVRHAHGDHLVNALLSQQAHLTMPVAGMGIAFDAEIRQQVRLFGGIFERALLGADVNRDDVCHA